MHLIHAWVAASVDPSANQPVVPDWVGAAAAAAPTVFAVYYLPVGLMLTRIFLNELHQVYGTA